MVKSNRVWVRQQSWLAVVLLFSSLFATAETTYLQRLVAEVEQQPDLQLAVQNRIHFNTNVSSFTTAREFYGKLGFTTLSGFPDTNTLAMAQAIGISTPTSYDGAQGGEAGGYLLHGELIGLGFNKGVIDLIEFTIPRNDAAPYPSTNRLGLSRAVIYSRNLDWDYANMTSQGITFLSAPTQTQQGTRFAIFKDPDGTFYELREQPGETDAEALSQFESLGAVVINVSDLQRSASWYRMLGFEISGVFTQADYAGATGALGFSEPVQFAGIELTHKVDGSTLELVEWAYPRDLTPPYPVPINHIGIHRMAFTTTDMDGDVAKLRAAGVRFISDVTPCCSGPDSWGGIVAFYDPDGTIMELADNPMMTVMSWIMRLFN